MSSLTSAFFLFLALSHFPSSYYSSLSDAESDKVSLTLYYDTLSESWQTFIVKNLATVFDRDLITVLNLPLASCGNPIICQKGGDECMLNTLQACSIDVWHDVNKRFGFIYCMEFLGIEGRYKDWNTCFSSLGLPEKPILDCYNSGNGTKLLQSYGYEVAHLDPPLTLVPWVLVNNQPLGNGYENFAIYVCKAYKGVPVPLACKY